MANVKFSRVEFEKHFKLTDEVINKIGLFGVSVEKMSDREIELEILPNRPDLLSMQGFIRAFKNFFGKEKSIKKYKIKKPEKNYYVKIDAVVKTVRPFTACAIVKNISFNDEKIKEIIDLQEKLHATIGRNRKKLAIGIYPLEKIELPITYTALPPEKINFIPLGANRKMSGLQIIQKHQTGKEYARLLEGFSKYPVFIDGKNNILSMPPIINSDETGRITNLTRDVFLECSGMDFSLLMKTLNIFVTALSDMGGEIYAMELDYGKDKYIAPNLTPEKMKLSLENTNKILGLNLKQHELTRLLGRMGYNYKNGAVEISPWRLDILHEVDIIEDIAIAYGYNRFIPELASISSIAEESQEGKIKSKLSDILAGLGLIEISSYSLIKKEEVERIKPDNLVRLEDSKTDYKFLRYNMLVPMLRTLSGNKDADYPQKLFEIGKVFTKEAKMQTETGIAEEENLIIALTPGNFTEMKQILDYFTKILCLEYRIDETNNKDFIEGRTASILINDKKVGYMGDLHPKTLNAWNIRMPVSVLEISLEEIFKTYPK